MRTPIVYQISIEEQLSDQWAEWLTPLLIERNPTGGTTLSGALRDQAELFGLLLKICNLKLTLVAVERIGKCGRGDASQDPGGAAGGIGGAVDVLHRGECKVVFDERNGLPEQTPGFADVSDARGLAEVRDEVGRQCLSHE